MDYKAEIFDKVQHLYQARGFNDHELHARLRFDRRLDTDLLRRALIASIAAIPILGTRYVDGPGYRWTSLNPHAFDRSFVTAATEAELEAFMVSRSDESVGPQVSLCVHQADSTEVAIKLNHMISDAAGFKMYLDFLGQCYSQLAIDPGYRPPTIDGNRGIDAVLAHFSMRARLKALVWQHRDNNRQGNHGFPLSEGPDAQPFIVEHRIEPARVLALKDYGRRNNATINDVTLTAYYRCLFRKLLLRDGDEVEIPIMVDMRRYLGEAGEFTALTNLTSMVSTRLDLVPDESFEGALGRIRALMLAKKSADIGLNVFVKLDLLFGALGSDRAGRVLAARLKQPFLCMTNIGILNPARMSFGGAQPRDAYVCGSIKYRPYFQLAVSSYNGALTFTVNQYGSRADREQIVSFLRDVDAELPGLPNATTVQGEGSPATAAGKMLTRTIP